MSDDEAPTEIMQRPDLFAELTPLPETWRGMVTEVATLAKDLAEHDTRLAVWALGQCRDLLSKARAGGS